MVIDPFVFLLVLFNFMFYYSYTHKLNLNSGNFEDGAILVDTLFWLTFSYVKIRYKSYFLI